MSFCLTYIRLHYQVKYHENQLPLQRFDVQGTVSDLRYSEHQGKTTLVVSLDLDMYKLSYQHAWKPISRRIILYCKPTDILQIDDYIQVRDVRMRPCSQDYKKYLIKEGVMGSVFISCNSITLITRPEYSLRRMLYTYRAKIRNTILTSLNIPTAALVDSIFFGNKQEHRTVLTDITLYFSAWGILHQLARSGLHLLIFMLLCSSVLLYIPTPFNYKQSILLALCCLYAVLSWSSISFVRALLSLFITKLLLIFRQPVLPFHLTGFLMLLFIWINPYHLFFLDFQLTFLMTLAVVGYGSIL